MNTPELMRIYYSCNNYPHSYMDIPCSRWKEDNYSLTIESFIGSGNRNTLFANLVPGAVKEQYNILGTPHFKDMTYSSGNTLIISPLGNTGLSGLRETRTVAVKHLKDDFLTKDYYSIKLDCIRIDL